MSKSVCVVLESDCLCLCVCLWVFVCFEQVVEQAWMSSHDAGLGSVSSRGRLVCRDKHGGGFSQCLRGGAAFQFLVVAATSSSSSSSSSSSVGGSDCRPNCYSIIE